LPPQAPPPPPFNPIGLIIGVIGGLCGILICWCTYVRQKKKRQPQDAGTAEKHAKHAADATVEAATVEAATIAQEAAEQRRRTVAEAEAERERRAKEAREAAQVTLMTRLVVEWSSLKLLYEVDKGGVGTVWEASLDLDAGDGKVIAESLLATGKAHLAAKAAGSGDAGATKDVPAGRFARFARFGRTGRREQQWPAPLVLRVRSTCLVWTRAVRQPARTARLLLDAAAARRT
jgi:hypothetical protein